MTPGITYEEAVDRALKRVTSNGLQTLAADLTAATGRPHRVYRDARGCLAVYPAEYERTFGLAGQPLTAV